MIASVVLATAPALPSPTAPPQAAGLSFALPLLDAPTPPDLPLPVDKAAETPDVIEAMITTLAPRIPVKAAVASAPRPSDDQPVCSGKSGDTPRLMSASAAPVDSDQGDDTSTFGGVVPVAATVLRLIEPAAIPIDPAGLKSPTSASAADDRSGRALAETARPVPALIGERPLAPLALVLSPKLPDSKTAAPAPDGPAPPTAAVATAPRPEILPAMPVVSAVLASTMRTVPRSIGIAADGAVSARSGSSQAVPPATTMPSGAVGTLPLPLRLVPLPEPSGSPRAAASVGRLSDGSTAARMAAIVPDSAAPAAGSLPAVHETANGVASLLQRRPDRREPTVAGTPPIPVAVLRDFVPDAGPPLRSSPAATGDVEPHGAGFVVDLPVIGGVGAEVSHRASSSGDALHVHFAVERPTTATLIADRSGGLDRALALTGVRLDTVSVEVRGGIEVNQAGGGEPSADSAGSRGGDPGRAPSPLPLPIARPVHATRPVNRDRFA